MWVKLGSWLVVVLLMLALVGCGGSSTSAPPPTKAALTSIAVTPAASTIAFGSTQQFTATGKYSDGTSKDISSTVSWASSANTVAGISGTGLATPVKGGQVTITATSGAISGSTTLTITTGLSSIAVSSSASGINVGQTTQFTAIGSYADGTTKDLTSSVIWTSSAPTVASISGSGLASGLKGGQASMMATSGSVNNSSTLTVTALLSSISVTPSSPGVFVGSTLQFAATGTYNDGTTKNLTSSVAWSSSDTTKATITTGGLASGLKGGQANITAAIGSVSNAASLNVTALLKSFSLSPIGPGVLVGSSQQFSAIGNFNDATTQDLTATATWNSSDTAKATIANGHATGVSAGPATITVSGTSADGTSVSANTALNVVSSAYASLNGNYAFTMLAADSRGPQMFAGSFHANPPDGSGHGTIDSGVEDANTSAGVVQSEPVSGSYIWYPDGRGTITFNSNRIHPSGIALRFVLAANGTTAGALGRLAQFDGKGTAKGTFELQNPSSFNNAAMTGTYVFRASGIDSSSQPMGQLGVFNSDGAGNITSGSVDTNDFGAITALSALSPASYSVGANGRGTLQFVSPSGTANFSVYVVDSTKLNLIQVDSGHTSAVAGVAELQVSQTYNASCLHGGYAFLIDRP
ncbi:MAG TPA: Ig-like domain-containing protein, partial [Terriglobales bacterium]|nr:Ig-like domain-containing protein [Terriglobales bacterium]